MGKSSSVKGANAEREARTLLRSLLRLPLVDRMLGAGRKEDVGDIHGVTGFTIQVADRTNLGQVLRHKTLECEQQQENGGTPYGVTLMKLRSSGGGRPAQWRFVMTPDQFRQIYDALYEDDSR